MKYLQALLLALLGSTNAYASCLAIVDIEDNDGRVYEFDYDNTDGVVNFGNYSDGLYGLGQPATNATITISNSCSYAEVLTLSISGNSGEFCLGIDNGETVTEKEACITMVELTVPAGTVTQPGTVTQLLAFRPLHPGKKKKRLSIDATQVNDDLSILITLKGEIDPFPQY